MQSDKLGTHFPACSFGSTPPLIAPRRLETAVTRGDALTIVFDPTASSTIVYRPCVRLPATSHTKISVMYNARPEIGDRRQSLDLFCD